MFANGQRVERDQVEHWIREAYAFESFRAVVVEREEPEHSRMRVTITITGPNGEALVAKDKRATYYVLRAAEMAFPQMQEDWAS